MYGNDMGRAITGIVWFVFIVGVLVGGIVWKVLSWLWHHIDVRWLA